MKNLICLIVTMSMFACGGSDKGSPLPGTRAAGTGGMDGAAGTIGAPDDDTSDGVGGMAGAGAEGAEVETPCQEGAGRIGPATIAVATANIFYTQSFNLLDLNVESEIRWVIESGTLPPGLTLNQIDGTLSGMTASAGDYTFTVATVLATPPFDCAGALATQEYSLLVELEGDTTSSTDSEVGADDQGSENSENMTEPGDSEGTPGDVSDGDTPEAECVNDSDCSPAATPRCEAVCDAGSCGLDCDAAPPADGPGCPADTEDPGHCAAACAYFSACAIDQCGALQEDSYVPLYEGCVERQCAQSALICIQNECGLLITLAQSVDAEFADVCRNGPPEE